MRRSPGIARRIAARLVPALNYAITCSGCGRRRSEDVRLVAGPGVYLCNQCIADAAERLTPRKPLQEGVRCGFCRNLRRADDVTCVGAVTVCADCLGMMEAILVKAPTQQMG